jgi:MFS family permease
MTMRMSNLQIGGGADEFLGHSRILRAGVAAIYHRRWRDGRRRKAMGERGGMTTELAGAGPRSRSRDVLVGRPLRRYPGSAQRHGYVALIVVATIALYYQSYAPGSVAPQILAHYGMTLRFYLDAIVVGFVIGAAASLLGHFGDRYGRRNLVAYGLVIVGVLVAFVQPHMPDKWSYSAVTTVVGLVEGVVLVATPALIRDFSPRLGRATAMGLWALGPVMGSLCATEVSSHTLDHLTAWQDQIQIAGIAGLVVSVIVVLGLKDLEADLRHQVVVTAGEAVLVEVQRPEEAQRQPSNVPAAPAGPWKLMVTPRIVSSAFAISMFLVFYYGVVGFFVIYVETVYSYSGSRANALANWYWIADALGLVAFGLASDRLGVRKPFMFAGGLGSLATTILFLARATHPHTGYYSLALILAAQALFTGMVYGPWFAGFTETIEDRDPALVATGLSVGAAVLRVVVAATAFCLPFVVTAVTPLVDYGPTVEQFSGRYPDQIATASAIAAPTLRALQANPADTSAQGAAVGQIAAARHVSTTAAMAQLEALARVPAPDLAYLSAHAPSVTEARAQGPGQWQRWWWIAVGGQAVFLALIPAMGGTWSPATARRLRRSGRRP